ncbi:binding-protein-dependent transport systems inner membrane component [Gloeomargarita lithophora Alchichica-D10]|uniref:Binding-protein-dependent transport systems inner membrane component n=1 Tax=Gloeomargarita lithophora Alchichica-D10 TaxID=1188229 RepID=A0A1J0AGG2_9CYAN|nr:sugar ABC transporter permease [Gloeomargarita lithophora]APB35022.1 binding-protein-dependent transport systems inner membrane component [Gloeomargarita lithophora Alchichica-D10]
MNQSRWLTGLFLLPALIILGLFTFWPLVYLLGLSFTQGTLTRFGSHWVGLENYFRLFDDPDFWQVVSNTGLFTVGTVVPAVVIPLVLALGLNQVIWGRGLWRLLYFLPSIISLVAAGLAFRWLLQTQGLVNQLLGISIPWLSEPGSAMFALILISVWHQIGFNLVIFLAGLQTIPLSQYEAAGLDGANHWQRFWYVTVPGLRPTLVLVAITTTLFTLRSFEPVYVLTGGGPLNRTNILVYYVYDQAFNQFDLGYAAAAAVVLFTVVLGLLVWRLRDVN